MATRKVITAREAMDELINFASSPETQMFMDAVYPSFTDEITRDAEETKRFIESCNTDEFEICGACFSEMTEAFGKPFLDWLLKHVEQKRTLTEYTEDMLSEAVSIAYDVHPDDLKDWMHPWLGKKSEL